ncbi:RICIN domain-containing protein [Streptomyces roseifaciens]
MAIAAAAIAATLPGTSQAAGPFDYVPVLIKNHNGKCLEIDGSSKSNGARAQQWDCNGQAGARWGMYYMENDIYQIVNLNSGKCLEVADSRKDNGAPVQQWTCVGSATQEWQKYDLGNEHGAFLYNTNSWLRLEVDNSSNSNGARIQQWQAAEAWGQNWYIWAA